MYLRLRIKKSVFEVLSETSVDLAILDVHLGQDNGYQLCRELKEHDDYPLACIKSNFSLLKKYLCRMNYDQSDHFTKDLNTCVEVLEETSEEFDQLKKITDKLLILDLPEDEIQSFSILEAINAAITFVKNQNIKCEIEISIEEGLAGILCNPTSLTDALFNLIDNAMAATKDSSCPKVTIKAFNTDNFITVKISDNGAGIPDKNLVKIFDPFFTTKEIGRATGIGLTNVQQTINQLHGSIDVQSKLGEGTTFTINLPLN